MYSGKEVYLLEIFKFFWKTLYIKKIYQALLSIKE